MKEIKKTLVGLLIGVASLGLTNKASAGPIWEEYNGHFYRKTPTLMLFDDAEAYAVSQGGHLVTINDAAEDQFLRDTLYTHEHIGIGLYQPNPIPEIEPDGGWEWVSGEPLIYLNWAPGEPNNLGGENWGELVDNGWNDRFNFTPIPWIVESPVPEPATLGLLALGATALLYRRKK